MRVRIGLKIESSPVVYRALRPLRRDPTERIPMRAAEIGAGLDVFVPITLVEAAPLARRFPLVWRRGAGRAEFGALLFLSAQMSPAGCAAVLDGGIRPLLVEAYPLAPAESDGASTGIVLDADDEPSGGAWSDAFGPDGAPTATLARSLNLLQIFVSDRPTTRLYSADLDEAGLLEDWPLRLRIGDDGVDLEGLCVLARDAAVRPELAALMERHGLPFAELVMLHEISLFAMQRLVDAHRSDRLLARARA